MASTGGVEANAKRLADCGVSEQAYDPEARLGDAGVHARREDAEAAERNKTAINPRLCCILVLAFYTTCLLLSLVMYRPGSLASSYWDISQGLAANLSVATMAIFVDSNVQTDDEIRVQSPPKQPSPESSAVRAGNSSMTARDRKSNQTARHQLAHQSPRGSPAKRAGNLNSAGQAKLDAPVPAGAPSGSPAQGARNLSRIGHGAVDALVPNVAQALATEDKEALGGRGASSRCEHQDVVSLAKCILAEIPSSAQGSPNFLFVMMGNKAFLPFIRSWLCNTAHMEGVHQRTLFLFTDDGDQALKASSQFRVAALQVDRSLDPAFQKHLDYDSYGYWLLVQLRVRVILKLINAGVAFLICEPDAVWVQNPLLDPALRTQADLIGFDDHMGVPGFGFLRVMPTRHVRALFQEMEAEYSKQMPRQRMAPGAHLHVTGEQDILHRLIRGRQAKPYKELRFEMLSRHKYVSGKWYDGGRGGDGRGVRDSCKQHGMPYVINNNWIVGNEPKITRAKRWGHWFQQSDGVGLACPNRAKLKDQVQKMISTMKTLQPLHGPPRADECPKC